MERERINRAISEAKEPEPTSQALMVLASAGKLPECWEFDLAKSVWRPVNWTGDDALNCRLLEEMSQNNAYVWLEWDINEWCVMWKKTTDELEDCSPEYNHKDRRVAVGLAWLRWRGVQCGG